MISIAAEVATEVATRLRDPDAVFGAEADSDGIVMANGRPVRMRDELSYDNGAAGIAVWQSRIIPSVPMNEYSRFLLSRAGGVRNYADAASAVQGLVMASTSLEATDPRWRSLRRSARRSLMRKAEHAVEVLEESALTGAPISDFGVFDRITGLGRDLSVLLATGADELQSDFLSRASQVLRSMLSNNRAPGVLVSGMPFLDMEAEHATHWNIGLAHGAAGIAHTLASVTVELQRRGHTGSRAWAAVEGFIDRALTQSSWGAPPMYATPAPDGRPRFSPAQERPSWCYGATGFALLMLAVWRECGREDFAEVARVSLIEAEGRTELFEDPGLCHGTSGLLVATWMGAVLLEDDLLSRQAARLTEKVVSEYRDTSPYGFAYRARGIDSEAHVPGVLTGAMGVAAALWTTSQIPSDPRKVREMVLDGSPWSIP